MKIPNAKPPNPGESPKLHPPIMRFSSVGSFLAFGLLEFGI
jgi:hypothetical protein